MDAAASGVEVVEVAGSAREQEGKKARQGRSARQAMADPCSSWRGPSPCEGLPDELLWNILARLSTVQLVQARSVSRNWNRVVVTQPLDDQACWCLLVCRLADHRFLSSSGDATLPDALPVTQSWAMDPASRRWHRVSLPAEPTSHRLHLFRSSAPGSGLLAFRDVHRGKPAQVFYWVGNPLTNRWRQIGLPPACPADRATRVISDELLFDSSSNRYTIARFRSKEGVGAEEQYSWVSDMYCSSTGRWSQGPSVAGDWCDLALYYTASTCVSQALGCVFFLQVSHHSLLVQVVAYHIQQQHFRLLIPPAPVSCSDGALSAQFFQLFVNHLGELECVAGIANGMAGFLLPGYGYPLDRFGVLTYQPESHQWVVDKATEVDIARCFGPDEPDQAHCTSFHITPGPGCLYLASHAYFTKILHYNAATKQWSRLADPFDRHHLLDKRGQWQESMATFLPRLDVKP